MTDFVKRIDSILQDKNLKRAALCADLQLSPTSITDWARRGTVPSGDVCLKIADYLNVSITWLISGKDSGLSNEERWIISQWKVMDENQKDTVRTLIEKWEADRILKEKKA